MANYTLSGKVSIGSNVQAADIKGKYSTLFIYAPGFCGTHRLYKKQVLGKVGTLNYSIKLPSNTYWVEACVTDAKGNKLAEGCYCSDLYNFKLLKNTKYNLVISDHCASI